MDFVILDEVPDSGLKNSDGVSQSISSTVDSSPTSGKQRTTNRVYWMPLNEIGQPRPTGTILQTGKSLYIVINGAIYNRRGIKMLSPVRSGNYQKVGCIVDSCSFKYGTTNWFNKGMLKLRR